MYKSTQTVQVVGHGEQGQSLTQMVSMNPNFGQVGLAINQPTEAKTIPKISLKNIKEAVRYGT